MGAEYRYTYCVDGHIYSLCRYQLYLAEKRGYTQVHRNFNDNQRRVKRAVVFDVFHPKTIIVRRYRNTAKPYCGLFVDCRYFQNQKAFRIYFDYLSHLAEHCNHAQLGAVDFELRLVRSREYMV